MKYLFQYGHVITHSSDLELTHDKWLRGQERVMQMDSFVYHMENYNEKFAAQFLHRIIVLDTLAIIGEHCSAKIFGRKIFSD
jgi:hypothetical protein